MKSAIQHLFSSLTTISWPTLLRLGGMGLLLILLWRVDLPKIGQTLKDIDWFLFLLAIFLNIPMVFVKANRWRYLLHKQGIEYGPGEAFLVYFGGIFIGLLTPGRLGEFAKIFHVSQDRQVRPTIVLASVLLDRLYDLYALMFVGMLALWSLTLNYIQPLFGLIGLFVVLTLPLLLIINNRAFYWLKRQGTRFGRIGQKLLGDEGVIVNLRQSLKKQTLITVTINGLRTLVAYAIFYIQCYLAALSIGLKTSFIQVSYAVGLGSLVTLLPISISGIGTRDVAIVRYLETTGISTEAAFTFSFLIFFIFYLSGGLMGLAAWFIKPIPVEVASLKATLAAFKAKVQG